MKKPFEEIRKRKTREFRIKKVRELLPFIDNGFLPPYLRYIKEMKQYRKELKFYNFVKKHIVDGFIWWCEKYHTNLLDYWIDICDYVNAKSDSNCCLFMIKHQHNNFMKHYDKFKKLKGIKNDNQKS